MTSLPPLHFKPVDAAALAAGPGQRRWYRAAPHADLQLWSDNERRVRGLDFSYRLSGNLNLLRCRAGRPIWHGEINEGEDRPGHYKASALLDQATPADWATLQAMLQSSSGLPRSVRQASLTILSLRPADPVALD